MNDLSQRKIDDNKFFDKGYAEGYAAAIEDAAELFICWQPQSGGLCQCPSCNYKKAIKALLSRGSR